MSRCALCPHKYNCVQPSGPECDILFLGEAPGDKEDKKGIPFVGPTGQEVDETYLPSAGLRRPNVRFDNAISCYPDTAQHKLKKDREKDVELALTCAEHHLYPYLRRVKPKVIVAMGAFANYVLDKDIDLDLHHGFPLETKWGTVFVMFHPAGGLHSPKDMLKLRTDFVRLGDYLRGSLVVPEDEYPNPDYKECNGYNDINEIDPTLPMACDTEYSRSLGPYCLTYSQIPGSGRLISARDSDSIRGFKDRVKRWESTIDWHNWLYDWNVTDQMGISFPHHVIRDTMLTTYNLGNMPQGLKALCYRELGMVMQDFDDLVIPYSRPHVINYYKDAYCQEWTKPEPQEVRDEEGNIKLYRPQSMLTKLKRFFTDLSKKPDKDVFKMFEDNWEEQQSQIEEKCGPYPGKDIAHVPMDKVIHYACRDADGTLRLRPILDKMVEQAQAGKSQERWRIYA